MRTGLNHSCFITALAVLLAVTTPRAATLEDLERMCHAGRDEYTAIRDAIVAEGESALPFLDATLADETKPWKVRFMAGVCTDYIRHGREIEAFLAKDWQKDPEYRPEWNRRISAMGFPRELLPLFFKRVQELGTWFFFVEVPLGLGNRDYMNNIYRWIPEAAMEKMPGAPRLFFAKWEEERTRQVFEGKNIFATSSPGRLERFATDGTYPEGADLLLAQKGYIDSPGAESLVQVTTNLALLEELKANNPNLIYRPGFQSRIDELRRRQEEARAEAEARAKAAARAALAKRVLFAVAASAVLLAAALLLHRALHRRRGGER